MSSNELTYYGGQAVLEGVMMRGRKSMAVAVRAPDGEIVVHTEPLGRFYAGPFARIPFLRGLLGLWDAFGLGYKSLNFSAQVAERSAGAPTAEAGNVRPTGPDWGGWLTLAITLVIGIGLFSVLPTSFSYWIELNLGLAYWMTTLIEDLLHFSRTGRGAVRDLPVPLAPVMSHLASIFNDRIAQMGAPLDVAEPLATPRADPVLLERVLVNLIDNALTYRCQTGQPRIRLSSIRDHEGVTISVADNGIGIAPEFHEKIFQVFQRLHSNDEYPGTGIGLAIVARAVRAMNGRIRVASTPDVGSVFSITLPAAD